MKKVTSPIPEGMNTVTTCLVFDGDCNEALAFYPKALNAILISDADKTPEGKIMHAMMMVGDSNIMLFDNFGNPETATGFRSNLWLYVADCDSLYKQAIAAGCSVVMPMEDAFWGDRVGEVMDPFGHSWNIASRKWELTPDEMKEREAEWMKKSAVADQLK